MAQWLSKLAGTFQSTFGIGPKATRATLSASGLTAPRTFTLPDATGTLALDFLSSLSFAENAITTTATATANRLNVCSGTSADYTVTLPTPSAGLMIAVAMDPALTKIVTVDAGSGKTIGHLSQSQKMWAGESLILVGVNSTTWRIVSGVCRPMICVMSRAANQSVANATETIIAMDTLTYESFAGQGNTGTGKITVKRTGQYRMDILTTFDIAAASNNTQAYWWLNSATKSYPPFANIPTAAAGTPGLNASAVVSLTAGNTVELGGYQNSGSSRNAMGTLCLLAISESPPW